MKHLLVAALALLAVAATANAMPKKRSGHRHRRHHAKEAPKPPCPHGTRLTYDGNCHYTICNLNNVDTINKCHEEDGVFVDGSDMDHLMKVAEAFKDDGLVRVWCFDRPAGRTFRANDGRGVELSNVVGNALQSNKPEKECVFVNTDRTLHAKWNCEANQGLCGLCMVPHLKTVRIEQDESATVSCEGGKRITIYEADYSPATPNPFDPADTCIGNKDKEVASRCEDEFSCSLTANDHFLGGNACADEPGADQMVLTVNYECIKTTPYVVRDNMICQDYQKVLRCDAGSHISIIKAMWGRKDRLYCQVHPADSDALNPDEHCVDDRIDRVAHLCDNKQECELTADDATMGADPCPPKNGTPISKYLKLSWTCRVDGETGPQTR